MSRRPIFLVSLFAAIMLGGISSAAFAADGCGTKPLRKLIVATLNRAPFVTLLANGHPVILILDTGPERTVLTPDTAERIGAQRPSLEFSRRVRGITGDLASHEVELRSFAAGPLVIAWHRVLVAPITMPRIFPTPLDGLLGADVLSDFDIDLDLAHYEMTFYEKQTCPTVAPDWRGPYISIQTGFSRGGRLFFPVRLDGHRLTAFIDTGSERTAISADAAHALGLSETLLSGDRLVTTQGIAAGSVPARVHRFGKLEVGTAVIRNPEILVADLKLEDADLVIGIDLLQTRRLWLSYGSRRVFLSGR